MSQKPILLTGATGFLGMEVLVRLLESGREVRALVRAENQAAADERLRGVLAGLWNDPSPYLGQVRAVAGDVTRPGLGISGVERAELTAEIGAICHCAASISFSLSLEAAREVNVEGTKRVIALAREVDGLERFLHVSTAYVAGMTAGRFYETQRAVGQAFRNTYEQTKWEAEAIVAAAEDLNPVIVRPSIVVGESDSGWTPAFNVLYWPLRAFSRGLFEAIPAALSARLDVVPVDYVADGLVALLAGTATGAVALVSGDGACTVDELIDLACARFDKPRPNIITPGSSGGGPATEESGAVYLPYFDVDVVYDTARAEALLGPVGLRPPRLATYFDRLMDYAELARWGKAGLVREDVRERFAALSA